MGPLRVIFTSDRSTIASHRHLGQALLWKQAVCARYVLVTCPMMSLITEYSLENATET